jgi:exodeoxyribonuclease VII small subunit
VATGTPDVARPDDQNASRNVGGWEVSAEAELTFEQLVEELEATIARMAGGNLGIEEVTDLYERAGRLHAQATERLAAISARIEKLTGPATGS